MKKEVFHALETGELDIIQSLHKQNTHVLLDVTFHGDTPLHIAAREGYTEIVEWILQVKPSLARLKNKDDNTPLHEAAKCGNPDLVRILLQHRKISVYKYNKFEETALIIASKYGHLETVKLLWEAKEYKDTFETRRSVRVAAYRGYADVAKAILENPIKPRWFRRLLLVFLDWDSYADFAKDVICFAMPLPSIIIVKFVRLQISSVNPTLHAAVRGGHVEIVKAVLNCCEWNEDLMTKKDKLGRCAIHVAAMKGHCEIINEFMFRWPDCVEIRSADRKSVLHFAVENNQFEVVRNLLFDKSPRKVAELVSGDRDGFHNTALHLAAKNGVDPQLVEYLVLFPGVDVNALNEEGMTAFDIACAAAPHNFNCAIIEQILDAAGGIQLSVMPKSNATSDPTNDSKQAGDKNIINTHMVVASLIATITFAAMFQIPGGIEDDKDSIHYGAAKMALHKLFRFFIFSDTAAFSTSLTVVAAWLVRQLFGDTDFKRSSVTFHISTVTLIFSIFWTIVAFVSATIIVTIPTNYDNLKSNDMKAFQKYESLWINEIFLIIIPPLYVCTTFLLSVSRSFGWATTSEHAKYSKITTYIQMCAVTVMILSYVLPGNS